MQSGATKSMHAVRMYTLCCIRCIPFVAHLPPYRYTLQGTVDGSVFSQFLWRTWLKARHVSLSKTSLNNHTVPWYSILFNDEKVKKKISVFFYSFLKFCVQRRHKYQKSFLSRQKYWTFCLYCRAANLKMGYIDINPWIL